MNIILPVCEAIRNHSTRNIDMFVVIAVKSPAFHIHLPNTLQTNVYETASNLEYRLYSRLKGFFQI